MPSNFIKKEKNWQYLIIALLIAIALWYNVNVREQIERVVEVRLDYKGLPKGLVVTDGQIRFAEVKIKGPSELLNNLSDKDLSYTIDLSKVNKGDNVILFEGDDVSAFRLYDVQEVTPSRLNIFVDELVEKTIPVHINFNNNGNKSTRVELLEIDPALVFVRGPEAALSKIKSLSAQLTLPSKFDEDVSLKSNAVVIAPNNIEVNPTQVSVDYSISLVRATVKLQREFKIENKAENCSTKIKKLLLRVSVPKDKAKDNAYLQTIQASVDAQNFSEAGTYDLYVDINTPEDAIVREIIPSTIKLTCE